MYKHSHLYKDIVSQNSNNKKVFTRITDIHEPSSKPFTYTSYYYSKQPFQHLNNTVEPNNNKKTCYASKIPLIYYTSSMNTKQI